MLELLLAYEDNGSCAKHVVVWHLDSGFERRDNSSNYWNAYDELLGRGELPECDRSVAVRVVLKELLVGFRAAIPALTQGGVAFVPYWFEDDFEAPELIRASLVNHDRIELLPVTGINLICLDISLLRFFDDYPNGIGSKYPVGNDIAPVILTRTDMLALIDASLSHLNAEER